MATNETKGFNFNVFYIKFERLGFIYWIYLGIEYILMLPHIAMKRKKKDYFFESILNFLTKFTMVKFEEQSLLTLNWFIDNF